jgi:hypothetical protein
MSGSLPIIHEEPHPPVAPSPQAGRVGEGFFYYGCLTGHDITAFRPQENTISPNSGNSGKSFFVLALQNHHGVTNNEIVLG